MGAVGLPLNKTGAEDGLLQISILCESGIGCTYRRQRGWKINCSNSAQGFEKLRVMLTLTRYINGYKAILLAANGNLAQ